MNINISQTTPHYLALHWAALKIIKHNCVRQSKIKTETSFWRRQRRSEEEGHCRGGGGAPLTDHKHSRRARVLQQAAQERYRRLKIGMNCSTSRDALEMSSRKKNLKYL